MTKAEFSLTPRTLASSMVRTRRQDALLRPPKGNNSFPELELTLPEISTRRDQL
jgi:hypothetical protein